MSLLDSLNTDDARLGLGLLAAGGYQPTPMSFGQRVQSAFQGQDAYKQGNLKDKLLQSQVDENTSQAGLRQQQIQLALRKQAERDSLLGTGQPAPAIQGGLLAPAPQVSAGAPAQPPQTAQPSSLAPEQQAAVSKLPPPPPHVQTKLDQISQQYKIPLDALKFDMVFNEGKGMPDLIAKYGAPSWQNVNGNLVNTNAPGFSGGMQAGMSSSADGKVTAWQPDGQGGVVVGAPKGALATFAAYQGVGADFKPKTVYNPKTKRDEISTEGIAIRAANQGEAGMRTDVQGNMGADPAGIQREILAVKNDLMKPLDANSKAQLQAYLLDLQNSAQVTPMSSGALAAGPSTDEATAAKAAEARAVDTAKADVVRDTGKLAEGKRYGQLTAGVTRAIELLKDGPTASGAGAMYDASAGFFGKSTAGADLASKLDTLSGWLTANVPRMEGPQSDKDVANYRIQAASVGDRTKPISQRLAAATELQRLQDKYAELNGGVPKTSGATGGWDDKPKGKALDALPTPNASNKGQRFRDAQTGKVLMSNGIQWKEAR